MECTIFKLLRKLKKDFPDQYIAISTDYGIFSHKNEIEIEYNLYIANSPDHCRIFPSIRDLNSYVEYICKPLTVNDVLNSGGETLIVD